MFLLVILAFVLGLYLASNKNKSDISSVLLEEKLQERNYEWAQFIAGYYAQAKTNAEKALIEHMLADIAAKSLPVPEVTATTLQQPQTVVSSDELLAAEQSEVIPQGEPAIIATSVAAANAPQATKTGYERQIDNASLLLYFGAFLFVASAGLFVAFGGLPGSIRFFIVLLVSIVLYGGGMMLYMRKPILRQAAVTFVGIGMAIAPLVGLAAYNYLFDQSQGHFVWFMTSIFCLALYAHALIRLRQPLLAYIFIFTLLSLFESSVSITNAPLYYYGWALALVGIALTVYSRLTGSMQELREPSRVSGILLVPLTIFVSLVLLPSQGAGQLGVSLLVAAAYYLLETVSSDGDEQIYNAITAQVTGLAGVGALTYALNDSWPAVSVALMALGAAQIVAICILPPAHALWRNIASVAIIAQVVAVVMAIQNAPVLLVAMGLLASFAFIVAWCQSRADAYSVAAIAWMTIPIVYGYEFSHPHMPHFQVVLLLLAALFVQFLIPVFGLFRSRAQSWGATLQVVYILSSLIPIVASIWAGAWWCFAASAFVSLSLLVLLQVIRDTSLVSAAGLIAAFPLLLGIAGISEPGAFLAANVFALLINIGVALRYRQEPNRWFSTILWLILPIALGSGVLGNTWGPEQYTWAYFVAMLGLILSRAIARGVLMFSSNVPMASFAQTASLSYVFGYCIAAVVALGASIYSDTSQIHTSVLVACLTLVAWVLSEYIEKRADLYAIIPLGMQAVLLSSLRPGDNAQDMLPWLLFSTVLATICYVGIELLTTNHEKINHFRNGALITVFLTPLTRIFTEQTYWEMPFGLFIATCLLFDHVRNASQQARELVGALGLLSVYWAMAFAGVDSPQAYSHVLVLLLAAYAYWRHVRNESKQSDNYIVAALGVATVPLVLQALSGEAGGLYGWWLLLEQVGILLLGIVLNKRFMINWGLYVAVAAVLYQLRHLGWAALTVLAIFLIGLAVYRLQKLGSK